MDYYGNNDYRDYLALRHHGILGMKWGKRNGPPYPLGSSDHSESEKKAGWRKSLGGGRNEESYGRSIKKKKQISSGVKSNKNEIKTDNDRKQAEEARREMIRKAVANTPEDKSYEAEIREDIKKHPEKYNDPKIEKMVKDQVRRERIESIKAAYNKANDKLEEYRQKDLDTNKTVANKSNELLNKSQAKIQEALDKAKSEGNVSDTKKDKALNAIKKAGLYTAKGAASLAKQGSYEYDREKYRKAQEIYDKINEIKELPPTSSKLLNANRNSQIKEYQNQIDELLSNISDENLERIRRSSRLL